MCVLRVGRREVSLGGYVGGGEDVVYGGAPVQSMGSRPVGRCAWRVRGVKITKKVWAAEAVGKGGIISHCLAVEIPCNDGGL